LGVRVLVYTGKGGVGKTSVAAATALRCAELGYRTLTMSTDQAHSLSDAFDAELGSQPTKLASRLEGMEIDAPTEIQRHWSQVYDYAVAFLSHYGVDRITAKELAILPGMDLAAALFYIDQFSRDERAYDVVVIDTAPTADTLRLLSFPDALGWYFERIFNVQRKLMKFARATVGKVISTPLPSDSVFSQALDIYTRLARAREVLTDPKQTSVRLVMNPQRMVINETRRAFTYLSLYGFNVDSVIVNRVLPDGVGEYFAPALAELRRHLKEIEATFATMKQFRTPRYNHEVVGVERLLDLASDLYDRPRLDPTGRFSKDGPLRFRGRGEYEVMELRMPFLEEKKLDIHAKGDTLFVTIGGFKRNIILPQSLVGAEVLGAEFDGECLRVRFRSKDAGEGQKKGKRMRLGKRKE
jgi:arsenite-transporting ATPase